MLKKFMIMLILVVGIASAAQAKGYNLLTENKSLVEHYVSRLNFVVNQGVIVDLKYDEKLFEYNKLEFFLEMYDDVDLRNSDLAKKFVSIGKIEFDRADYLASMIASDPSFLDKGSLHQFPHYQRSVKKEN
jgi:hypothetical protein